jgi:hypothetical protein
VTLRTAANPTYVAAPALKASLKASEVSSSVAQNKAEDALYWVASPMQGLVAAPSRMKELQTMYREAVGLAKTKGGPASGLYGGVASLTRDISGEPHLMEALLQLRPFANPYTGTGRREVKRASIHHPKSSRILASRSGSIRQSTRP